MYISDSLKVKPLTFKEVKELYFSASTEELTKMADNVCRMTYGEKVFLRGLIEFSNVCRMDCKYCGIRRSNKNIKRYTMSEEEILNTVKKGIEYGFKTFVLQSGETTSFNVYRLAELVERIKLMDNSVAVTLSCGYFNREELRVLKNAGVDRYLIRFEVSDKKLYSYFKNGQKLSDRLEVIYNLKELGFEAGSGFMVGLPGETDEILLKNLKLCKDLELDMVGIGPFIPHPDTPLRDAKVFPIERTVRATALLRLLLPYSNIPATTAAGTLDPVGREKMLKAGANVLMPNITPPVNKRHYLLYPDKICISENGENCISCMRLRVESIGKKISFERGNSLSFTI
ncbi:MAG: [FeFe] hydrogenase H-cluster radical SAM maturase HydE [Brevinematia bacterium]